MPDVAREKPNSEVSRPGDELGSYRLCLEVASGGMGSVFLGHHLQDVDRQRFLAIKVIHPHLADDSEFLAMFADEAEIASRIRHPNVCSVIEHCISKEHSFLVMEFLRGESLLAVQRRLKKRPVQDVGQHARIIATLLAGACEGLHAAHELVDRQGRALHIVHRDVTPSNLFLSYDGVPKVLDFGVASATTKRHRTRTGVLKGKFAYVAPESMAGVRANRRVDVWGIGVVAWELLTGQRLFRRKNDLETLHAVAEERIRPPSEVCSQVPEEVSAIVMAALERNSAKRTATARELGRQLARFASNGTSAPTTADLSEWLEELFPDGRGKTDQLLEVALQIVPDTTSSRPAPRTSIPPPPTSSFPAIAPPPLLPSVQSDLGDLPTRVRTRATPTAEVGRQPQLSSPPAPRPPNRRWTSASLVLGLGILLGAVGGYVAQQAVEPIPRVEAEAPISHTPPPILHLAPRPTQLEYGEYFIELTEGADNALSLRIHPRAAAAPAPAEPPAAQDPIVPATTAPPARASSAAERRITRRRVEAPLPTIPEDTGGGHGGQSLVTGGQ